MNYTKREWEFLVGDEDFIVLNSETSNTICLVPFYKEGEANANLIAAAPEMYEALLYIKKLIAEMYKDSDTMDFGARKLSIEREIQKTLAKAEGKDSDAIKS